MSYLLPRLDLVTNSVTTTISVGTTPTEPTYVTGDIPQQDNIIIVGKSDNIKTTPALVAIVQPTSIAQNLSGVTLNLPEGGSTIQSYTDLANQNYTYDANLDTQLLVGHGVDSSSTTIVDLSSNNYNVVYGGTGTSSAAGSLSFNGNSNYLSTPANANYNLYQVSFTIEAWIYCSNLTNGPSIWALGTLNSTTYTNFGININGSIYFQVNSGTWAWTTNYSTPAGTLLSNTWTHVAVVRDYVGGTFKMFINGQQQYTTSSYTEANGSTGTAFIGTYYGNSNWFTGNISNFRLIKGTAQYTTNFTPTVPLTNVTNTKILLLTASEANKYLDSSSAPATFSGSPTYSTNVPSLGSSAAVPIGSSPYTNSQFNCFSFLGNAFLNVPDNAVYYIGAGTTTITFEAWFYPTSHPATAYFASQTSTTSTYPWAMYFVTGKPTWSACAVAGTAVVTASSATTLSLNTWTHVAWVYERAATRFVVYINGVREVLATNAVAMFNSTDSLRIGASTSGTAGVNFYNGYIADIRSTNSDTTYSGNFTVPTHNILASYPIANPYGGSNTAAMTSTAAGGNYCNLLISAVGGINNVVIDTGPLNQTITSTNVVPANITNASRAVATTYNSASFNYNINLTNGANANNVQLAHSTNLDLSTGTPNWCVEGWIYWSGLKLTGPFAGQGNTIFEKDAGAGYTTVSYGVGIDPTGIVKGSIGQTNIASQSVGLLPMPINTWTHIAFCRKGTVITLYVNGIASESATITVTMTDQGYISTLGSMNNTPYQGGGYFQGYISNFRVVKGNNVYSGTSTTSPNFSLPTQAFTAAQAGNCRNGITGTQTSYLFGFIGTSSTICDLSVWAVPGASNSVSTLPTAITNLPPNLTFPTSTYAYNSVYLNGSGYLNFLTGKPFQLGQEEFTVEFWFYQDVLASAVLVDNYVTSAFKGAWQIWSSTATGVIQFFMIDDGAASRTITSAVNAYAARSWNHVALVRRKTFAIGVNQYTITLYVNGASVGTLVSNSYLGLDTVAATPTLARGANIGRQTSDGLLPFTGYISDLRIIKQALYTNNFAPPTSQLQVTPQISPTPSYGVLAFNGVNQYLGVPAATSSAMDLATGSPNWTIECWVYLNNTDATYIIFNKDGASGSKNSSISLNIQGGGGQQLIIGNGATGGPLASSSQTIMLRRWTHIAAVRNGSSLNLYVNGITGTTQTAITMFNDNNPFYIGAAYDPSPRLFLPGYIANFRVVRGTALYSGSSTTTANFTPPPLGTPLANVANTVLLLNPASEINRLQDSSASNLNVTGSATYTALYNFNTVNITTTPIGVVNSGNVIYTKASTTSSTTTARYEPLTIKSEYAVNYSASGVNFNSYYRTEVADVTINSFDTINDNSKQVLAANILIPVKDSKQFFINGTDATNTVARDPNFRDVRILPVTNLNDPRRVDVNRPLFDLKDITGETVIDQQAWIS